MGEYSSGVETSISTTPVCSATRNAGSGGKLRVVGAVGAVTMGGASRTIGAGGGLSGMRPIGGGRSAPSAGGTNGALRPRIMGAAAGAQAPARFPTTVVRGLAGKNGGGGCNCSPAMVGSTGGPLTGAATVTDGKGRVGGKDAAVAIAVRAGGSGSGGSGGNSGSGGGHGSVSVAVATVAIGGGGGLGLLVGSQGS